MEEPLAVVASTCPTPLTEDFAADLASVRLQADRYAQVVNVYQAMGGGWVDIASEIAPKPQSTVNPGL